MGLYLVRSELSTPDFLVRVKHKSVLKVIEYSRTQQDPYMYDGGLIWLNNEL